jgi:hypothetical protein
MITINKKMILSLAITSISWLAQAATVTIPHESIQAQDVSLFLLVQDHNGEHKGGFFEIDTDEPVKKINTEDFQSIDDATLSLEGEEVAVFDFGDDYSIRQDIVYFDISADVRVIRALIINNSLLAAKFISVIDLPLDDIDFDFDCFDDDLFGDVEEQQEAMATKSPEAQKSFSAYQIYSLVRIGVLMQYDSAKRLCKRLNNKAKLFARWLDGSSQA